MTVIGAAHTAWTGWSIDTVRLRCVASIIIAEVTGYTLLVDALLSIAIGVFAALDAARPIGQTDGAVITAIAIGGITG